jgi:hypothetical protein
VLNLITETSTRARGSPPISKSQCLRPSHIRIFRCGTADIRRKKYSTCSGHLDFSTFMPFELQPKQRQDYPLTAKAFAMIQSHLLQREDSVQRTRSTGGNYGYGFYLIAIMLT